MLLLRADALLCAAVAAIRPAGGGGGGGHEMAKARAEMGVHFSARSLAGSRRASDWLAGW